MSTRSLPARPHLDQLKLQAAELHRAHRDGHPSAAARIAARHPRMKRLAPDAILDAEFALADAQLVVAREYGFDNWAQLKRRVEVSRSIDRVVAHPGFGAALAALDAGDLDGLRALLAADPSLAHARANLDPPYGYFTGATLLHHVAGNPDRGRPLPDNIVEIARLLLGAGADVNAKTLGPSPSISPATHGSTTIGLVVTSRQASDAGVTGPLMDLLLARGAELDLQAEDALDASLTHHAPRAAEKMIELGAKPDLLAAAALGRLDWLRARFGPDGTPLAAVRRQGREMSARDAVGLALLYAYVRRQREAVDFLLGKDGNWNITGVSNGTALHRAAFSGDLEMVQTLVAKGADVSNRDNPFWSTPLGWAEHNGQAHVVEWLQRHAPIDLHDAVAFDLRDRVTAHLRGDPASVNRRIDHGDIPQGTPLHAAASWNRVEIGEILYANGGHRDALAGNGMTPLDVADANGSAAMVAFLEERGARRAADAPSRASLRARPRYRIDEREQRLETRPSLDEQDWDAILDVMAERKIPALDANGQMTDAVMERVARLDHITRLELGGSRRLTDAGAQHLARLPRLEQVNLAFTPVTDRGAAALGGCTRLERVILGGTRTGDAALEALSRKPALRTFACGLDITDAGLALLREFPVFRSWQGGEIHYRLMEFEARPNYLLLHREAPFAHDALRHLRGLDGLFGLNLDNPCARNMDLAPLMELPRLGWLGHDATDESMARIAALPHLRMLMAQDTVAGDAGFAALSRSATLEYIWGRRCYNLTGRGFAALSAMPSLRGLSVSCRNVDDAALSLLPRFPALKELMPMDVQDAGFRHVGRCESLEALWCMYCRDTTDAATERISGLTKLATYYAGATKITDRSLEILGGMASLERLTFWNCAGITNAGAESLSTLPRLSEVAFDDCGRITPDVAAIFPAHVRVNVSSSS